MRCDLGGARIAGRDEVGIQAASPSRLTLFWEEGAKVQEVLGGALCGGRGTPPPLDGLLPLLTTRIAPTLFFNASEA